MTSSLSGDSRERPATPASQTLISLLIFGHFFFVFVALSSNYARSGLTRTLLSRFAFYSRLFNFDLDYTPYHLTHGSDEDVDHRIEVLAKDAEDWVVLPDGGLRGHDAYKRYQRFAAAWAFHGQNDGQPALFAQAVGTHFSRQRGIAPKQVRCRKHFQQAREEIEGGTPAQRDPNGPSRFSVSYAANAIVNDNGSVDVIRVEEAGQVAAPVTSAGGARGTNANERSR